MVEHWRLAAIPNFGHAFFWSMEMFFGFANRASL
jgi:hypothetical protein